MYVFMSCRAYIDSFSCRLHRAAYTCSKDLCLGTPTTKYIGWCMNRVRLLQQHNVTPVFVFDGARLPGKAGTEAKRRRYATLHPYLHLQLGLCVKNMHTGLLALHCHPMYRIQNNSRMDCDIDKGQLQRQPFFYSYRIVHSYTTNTCTHYL